MAVVADISQPAAHHRIRYPRAIAIAVLSLVAILGVLRLLPTAGMVDRVTIRNDSSYDIEVDATGLARDGWTPLGVALANTRTEVRDVIDQGDVWIFRFLGQGRDGGEVRVTRAQLEADDWVVTVPAAVAERIRSAGAAQTPA